LIDNDKHTRFTVYLIIGEVRKFLMRYSKIRTFRLIVNNDMENYVNVYHVNVDDSSID